MSEPDGARFGDVNGFKDRIQPIVKDQFKSPVDPIVAGMLGEEKLGGRSLEVVDDSPHRIPVIEPAINRCFDIRACTDQNDGCGQRNWYRRT